MSRNSGCDCEPYNAELVEKVQNAMISEEMRGELSNFFKVIADETRMRIMAALSISEELCVSDIANIVNMTKSAVSHQLSVLRTSGLVKARREGKNMFYSLDDHHVVEILDSATTHIQHRHVHHSGE